MADLVCPAGLCGGLSDSCLSLCSHREVGTGDVAIVLSTYLALSKLISACRYLVPDISDALKQRIQREAFLCNELTIREEDFSKDNEDDEENVEEEEIH